MKIKNIFKTGLVFGIAMAILFTLQNFLTDSKHTSTEISGLVVEGIITVIVTGFLYGWLVTVFAKWKFVQNATKIITEPGETILFETPANHFKGIEAAGGKLYLTNTRLVFKSHKFNIRNHQLSINLNEINNVSRYKTLGVVNNGLVIITKKNTAEKFAVNSIDEWIAFLQNKNLAF